MLRDSQPIHRRAGQRSLPRCAWLGVLGIVILLAGCATPYRQVEGITLIGGCRTTEIGTDAFKIYCSGNGYTSRDRIRLYVMYRCAEVTLEKGADYFVEVEEMQTSAGPKTILVSPGGTYGFPGAPSGWAAIKIIRGDKPVEYPGALNAREVKAEIDAAFFQKK